ncbi:hypothetical protein AAMO2058_001178300, partial [Amorphochlora amoebiformis]
MELDHPLKPGKDSISHGKRDRPELTRLASEADYVIRGTYTADTRDYEDHTFSGIMFDVQCKNNLPIHHLEITHIWVRGELGHVQIFHCEGSIKRDSSLNRTPKHGSPELFTKIHDQKHEPSIESLKEMKLTKAIRVEPGQTAGIYVHSTERGDQAIVYNNQRSKVTVEDRHFKVLPGMAHVSNVPFSIRCPWGYAWRDRR